MRWREEGLPVNIETDWTRQLFKQFDDVLFTQSEMRAEAVNDVIFRLTGLASHFAHEVAPAPIGEWALCVWILDHVKRDRFWNVNLDLFLHIDKALRELLLESHIGQLICWRRRMDEAYQPITADDKVNRHSRCELEPIPDPCSLQMRLLLPVFEDKVCFTPSIKVPLILFEGRPTILIIHLFSGRRRVGDCHWWLEHLSAKLLPEYPVKMIAVDTAIDPVFGDLSSGANYDLILGMAKGGAIAASLTGPPLRPQKADICTSGT